MTSDSDLSNDFKNKTMYDLAVIKHRLLWLLMPTFILLGILGLSILTWIEVNELQEQNRALRRSIDNLNEKVRPTEKAKETTSLHRGNGIPLVQQAEVPCQTGEHARPIA